MSHLPTNTPEAPTPDVLVDAGVSRSKVTLRHILWPILLSLLVLVIIGYVTFEPDAFQQIVENLNPWLLFAAVLTVIFRVFFGAWRLNYVSHGRLSLLEGLRAQLAWDFFSNITPSTIGGGPIAAAYIARDRNIPLGDATGIMLFSMLLDQLWFALTIPLILACALFLEVIPASLGVVGFWTITLYFLALLTWVGVFGYAMLFRPQLIEKVLHTLCGIKGLRRFRERVQAEMQQLRRRSFMLRSQKLPFYLNGMLLTFGTWIGRYLLVVFIIWSVYPNVDHLLALLRTVALTLGSLIMPTPGGAGGLEGLYALFMEPLMPKALVVPTLLTWRLLGYYIFIAIGAFLTMHQVQKTIRRKRRQPLITADAQPQRTSVSRPQPEPVDNLD